MITLSINPLYRCNFRCNFCYLTKDQLGSRKELPLSRLREMISEITESGVEIGHVDLYGGEIGLLDESYLNELDEILLEAGDPTLNIVTNLSIVNPFFLKDHVDLSVSFDFECRQSSDKVLNNIITCNKDISILMLASKELMNMPVTKMISTFNQIQNIKSVEIKPYSTNSANDFDIEFTDFEDFVKKWLELKSTMNFNFVNEREIIKSIDGKRNAFSDDHVYITPEGKFAVLEFDDKEREYFLSLDKFDDYLKWSDIEKTRVQKNSFCSKCKYFGKCLTEHYREVRSLENSCNGFHNLIEWYKAPNSL